MVIATQYPHHPTIQEVGLEENRTIQDNGQDSLECLLIGPSTLDENTQHIPHLTQRTYEDNKFPSQIQEPPPRFRIEGEDEYELNEIINSRLHYNKLQYRAK